MKIVRLMLLVFTLVAVACRSESEPFKAYRSFADAYLNGRLGNAQVLTMGAAKQKLQNMVNPPEGQPYVLPLKETVRQVHSINYTIDSEVASADSADLTVRVRTRADRPGTHSVGGSTTVAYEHKVHLTKTESGWKVDTFDYSEVAP